MTERWIENLSASERGALRDAGRIGLSRFEGPTPILVPVPVAARLMGVSEDTIRALEGSGTLPSVRIGRRVLFSREELERWAREHTGKEVTALTMAPPWNGSGGR